MSRLIRVCGTVVLVLAAAVARVHAQDSSDTIAVVMTNDPDANAIKVYDTSTGALLQTLPTHGKGGVGNNARGVKQYNGQFLAAVNNGSNTVALFRRDGRLLRFDKLVSTTSAPVSIDFGNDHMYVAGATTVDSFVLHEGTVEGNDGTTLLQLADGSVPPTGSTAQVGVIDRQTIIVTLKADPDPGAVDVVALRAGTVSGAPPTVVPGPDGTLAPFGFSVYPDGTAVISLAHSANNGLFRDGGFSAVIDAQQTGPCWTTIVGKYVFVVNTGSKTISRLIGTGGHLFIDDVAATTIATGGSPTDADADGGIFAVIDHVSGQSHLSLFTYNEFGELAASGTPIALGVANPNGVAVMTAAQLQRR